MTFHLISIGESHGFDEAESVAIFKPITVIAITTGFLSWFYTYGWFTGSILGGLLYWVLARGETRSAT